MSPGKKEFKWQRAELCEDKLIVKMGDRLARNAANDFLVACRLFDARWRRWERDERIGVSHRRVALRIYM